MPSHTTNAEAYRFYKNFDTCWLTRGLASLEELKAQLKFGPAGESSMLQRDYQQLHQLAQAVIDETDLAQAPALFDLAMALETQILALITAAESLYAPLQELLALYPESLLTKAADY